MASHDDHPDSVRRRHSSHYDEDDDIHSIPARHDTLPDARRSAADPDPGYTSSSGTDIPLNIVRNSTDQPRVRFSLQEQRPQAPPSGKRRKSDEDVRSGLTIDTTAASAHSVLGENTVASPSSTTSLPGSGSIRPKVTSPLSPHGRSRGYSLRSSLFQRNMRDRSADPPASPPAGSIIEMTPVGPSNQPIYSQNPNSPRSNKKSMDTVVEVAPMHDNDRDLEEQNLKLAVLSQRQGVQGIGALPHYQNWIQERAARNNVWRSIKAGYTKARKFALRINEIPPTKDGRHIDLDPSRKATLIDERTGKAYLSNTIRSSRYTAWSFVPRQLFAQFSKLANFYFLCVSILQMIPGLSTTGSK